MAFKFNGTNWLRVCDECGEELKPKDQGLYDKNFYVNEVRTEKVHLCTEHMDLKKCILVELRLK